MDLTKNYPRSVREQYLGLVQLGRAVDKGKATAAGTNGEYNFDCPMDKAVFDFLELDGAKLLDVIRGAKSDEEIDAYLKPFVAKKRPDEIARFNEQFVQRKPTDDSLPYFLNLRNQAAPERTDVTTWADLLDLDEKRHVPLREPASV